MGKVYIKSDFEAAQGFKVDGKKISILPGKHEYNSKDIDLLKKMKPAGEEDKNSFVKLLGVSFHESSEKEEKKAVKNDKALLEKIEKLEGQLKGFEGVDVAALKSQVASLENTVKKKDEVIQKMQAELKKAKAE